ncbi:uncharacterized protein PV09_03039 [Verruconis gallopava]|uniref:Uncharacterized protein n=1 Tax=Verruconis gallopava TaxID=253628 RepID=A0A0D2AGY9_9PEZI|nr:uncharacterized protein PV09_03039 [Verruconis gallopava]KIW05835.1 hypothetical protein PV09_03039 [Verruconis gallopava]
MGSSFDPRRNYMSHPTKGAGSVFAILFAFAFTLHVYQNIKYRCWRLNWLTPCTAIIFLAGSISLEYSAFHPTDFSPSQGLFYSGSAVLVAAYCVYLVYLMATQHELKRWWNQLIGTVFIFTLSGVISLTAQGTSNFFGTGATPSSAHAGLQVLRAGVTVLLAANIVSLVVFVLFYRHIALGLGREDIKRQVKVWISVLWAIGILLLARNLFRTVQIFLPASADLWTSEAYFWIFEAAIVFVCIMLLNLLPPVLISPARNVCTNSC